MVYIGYLAYKISYEYSSKKVNQYTCTSLSYRKLLASVLYVILQNLQHFLPFICICTAKKKNGIDKTFIITFIIISAFYYHRIYNEMLNMIYY